MRAGDRIQLVTVVTNDRAVPISVGMTSPTGRVLTISLDEDFGYERTKVCHRGCTQHVGAPARLPLL